VGLFVVVFDGLAGAPSENRIQEALNVAIEHVVEVALLVLRARVFHALVRM
jgi:hypothetical protein